MKIFCPYRICPLGAHVDHQLGLITGFVINKGITLDFESTFNSNIKLFSINFNNYTSLNINDSLIKTNNWDDYLKGAIYVLKKKYKLNYGINGSIKGDLPIGGLSSSAAVSIVYLLALSKVNNISLSQDELISLAYQIETEFLNLHIGKLDQNCEVLSKKDSLLFLDTYDNTYKLIEKNKNMKSFKIAIIFSGIERKLINSNYNLRVDECKMAAKLIDNKEYLREVPYEKFIKTKLPDNLYKRALHFYEENQRVKEGIEAWKNGNLEEFGKFIFESGYSSIYNYEVGSDELIELYNIMKETNGIYGGRFSGAGFNGSCFAIIDPDKQEEIALNIKNKYINKFPHFKDKFEIYFCDTTNGVNYL